MLLYEAGTFYHAYEFDAQVLVSVCGLNYTRPPVKGQIRCAGVPIAHANGHIATLLREGEALAIEPTAPVPSVRRASGHLEPFRTYRGPGAAPRGSLCREPLCS